MHSESEWIYERKQLYAMMKAHPEWSLRAYAREVQHDLRWVRKWTRRFRECGEPSASMFRSQSRRPKHSPTRLTDKTKDRIYAYREQLSERFHRSAGAKTIWHFLNKAREPGMSVPCLGSIQKTLRERRYIQHHVRPVPLPLVLPAPMEEWEMDFGEIYLGEVEGTLEFFLVVDRGTSRVVYLEGAAGYQAVSALEAVMRLFVREGLPKRLRFDRDPRLWGSWTRDSYPSPLVRLLHALGVEPIVCPPHRPDKKPMVERCIRTLKYEWLARHSPTTFADAHALLEPFVVYHNTARPRQGDACQNQIPDEAFPTLPTLRKLPARVQPNTWLTAEQGRVYRRRINASGAIQVDKHSYYIGEALAGVSVLVHLDAPTATFHITRDGHLLKRLPMKGIHPLELDLFEYLRLAQAEARSIEQFRHAHWEQTGEML